MTAYLSESGGAILAQTRKFVAASKELSAACNKVFTSLVGPSDHLRHMQRWTDSSYKTRQDNIADLRGDGMTTANQTEIRPQNTTPQQALAFRNQALPTYKDTVEHCHLWIRDVGQIGARMNHIIRIPFFSRGRLRDSTANPRW